MLIYYLIPLSQFALSYSQLSQNHKKYYGIIWHLTYYCNVSKDIPFFPIVHNPHTTYQ